MESANGGDHLKQLLDRLGLSFTDTDGNPANDLIQQLVPDGECMLDTKT